MLSLGLIAAVSFVIMMVLGVDFAAFWALVIFAFNFIPIIGSIVAVILPCVLALVQPEGGPGLALLTLGLLTAAEAGATAVIQPGGSMRDEDVIAAADEAGLAMVLTGMRHFRH